MMNVNELMIGDWVQIQYRNKKVKVTGIHDGMIDTNVVSPIRDDEFEPIPLTSEILEVNGFDKVNETARKVVYDMEFEYCAKYLTITLLTAIDRVDISWSAITYPEGQSRLDLSIWHCKVHQLQHALRLCGIDKEITVK